MIFIINERHKENSKKMYKQRARLDIRKFLFPHSVVDIWNSLQDSEIQAPSVQALFKHFRQESTNINETKKSFTTTKQY